MTRTEALKALDDAFAERIKRMFGICADGFAGSANAKVSAEKNFANGLDLTVQAHEFMAVTINQKFKD